MAFVIDASVAVKFLTIEVGTEQALEYIDANDALLAPDLIMVEVANALWKKVKDSALLEVHAERALADLPEFFDPLASTLDLMPEAFRLSFRLRHAVYDCVYLALALAKKAVVVTADRKFFSAASSAGYGSNVQMLAES